MNQKVADLLGKNNLFGLEYIKVNGPHSMPASHYHEHYELFYLLSGERYYFIHDRTYHIKKGDLVLINAHELHKTIDAGVSKYQRVLINFKEEFLTEFLQHITDIHLLDFFQSEVNIIHLNIEEQTFLEALLLKMNHEYKVNTAGSNTYIKMLMIELLIFINRLPLHAQNAHCDYPNDLHKKISVIVKYINENFSENLTLNSISDMFYISPHYFCHKFKEVTGFTFIQFLNIVRIKKAQELLIASNTGISDIAGEVGFDSATHFGRTFKSIIGTSPVKYRKSFKRR